MCRGCQSFQEHIENSVFVYSHSIWRWRQRCQDSLIDYRYFNFSDILVFTFLASLTLAASTKRSPKWTRPEWVSGSRSRSQMAILDFWLEIELNQFSFSFIESLRYSESIQKGRWHAGILNCIFYSSFWWIFRTLNQVKDHTVTNHLWISRFPR